MPPSTGLTERTDSRVRRAAASLLPTRSRAQIGGYSCTGRGPVPVAERDPITGALTGALWSPDLVVI
jgi:hypothetical protein